MPGGGLRLTGPTGRAPEWCTAPHILPGGGLRLTGPPAGCRVSHRMYCPVAAHAYRLRAGRRDCVSHRMYCPVAARALPGLRTGHRDGVSHRIYCPVAHALPGLRAGRRDCVSHRMYCPVAAHALPGLRAGRRDRIAHRHVLVAGIAYGPLGTPYRTAIYCPVAARALMRLRTGRRTPEWWYRTAYIARWRLAPYRTYSPDKCRAIRRLSAIRRRVLPSAPRCAQSPAPPSPSLPA
jgi:hypothetical protein